MKFDMDLARKILFAVEDYAEPNGYADINIEGYTNKEISYHIKLLSQANLIEAFDMTDSTGFDWKAKSLTWEGHQFLDSARNTTHWTEAKKKILEKGGSLTFEMIKVTLSEILKNLILPTP